MNQQNPHWKFTVRQYGAMTTAGILTEDDRTELIDGEILAMAAKRDDHVVSLTKLTKWFYRRLSPRAGITVQDPVILSERDEPEPDLMLIRVLNDEDIQRKPRPEDVHLVIEVADTTLRHDRNKLARYALAGIPEVWIVNLNRRVVEVYRDPAGKSYSTSLIIQHGQSIAPLSFPDAVLAWQDFFTTQE